MGPAMVETRVDPKFKGVGKASLGQHLPLKGDTVKTKVTN